MVFRVLSLKQGIQFRYLGSWTECLSGPGKPLRWLDWIFLVGYLPSLSINYVAINKDMEKKLP